MAILSQARSGEPIKSSLSSSPPIRCHTVTILHDMQEHIWCGVTLYITSAIMVVEMKSTNSFSQFSGRPGSRDNQAGSFGRGCFYGCGLSCLKKPHLR